VATHPLKKLKADEQTLLRGVEIDEDNLATMLIR
jgi:hypothetical protein